MEMNDQERAYWQKVRKECQDGGSRFLQLSEIAEVIAADSEEEIRRIVTDAAGKHLEDKKDVEYNNDLDKIKVGPELTDEEKEKYGIPIVEYTFDYGNKSHQELWGPVVVKNKADTRKSREEWLEKMNKRHWEPLKAQAAGELSKEYRQMCQNIVDHVDRESRETYTTKTKY